MKPGVHNHRVAVCDENGIIGIGHTPEEAVDDLESQDQPGVMRMFFELTIFCPKTEIHFRTLHTSIPASSSVISPDEEIEFSFSPAAE